MTGLPASLGFPSDPGLEKPPENLQEADKRRRTGEAYEQENQLQWRMDASHR